ncbi:glycosyltransferase family 4 protein [Methanococcoides sp. LMO-2]|uniref:Glycosyltransferase family 4 protein n=1 Tax=Methanococcoides cohabitans TaxID=3136559 RepID=A0ABU9KQG7_9EURY
MLKSKIKKKEQILHHGTNMNILIFNWRDTKNPAAGGAEVFTQEIAKRLVAQGHEISLFTSAFDGCKNNEIVDGVQIIRSGNRYSVYLKAKQYYKKHAGEFDIVVDEINTRPFMSPKFVKDGTPVVALIHQLAREFWFLETRFPINWIGYHILEDRWLKTYIDTPTMTVSHSTKQDLIDLGFKDLTIIPEGLNIVPVSDVPEKEEGPTFIFVGRMGHAKRPDHVVEAFVHIKKRLPDAKLWMVGDGAMRQELETKKVNGITFFGYVTAEKKYELMSRAHAILVPGVREGWGLIVTEANAMGTPAIGYNIHGLRDSIRDGKTGLLCDPDPENMAEKAVEFMRDTDMQTKLSDNALEWAREFDWNHSAETFFNSLEAVL